MNADTRGLSYTNYVDNTETKRSDFSKVLIGALAGVVVGSLVGGAFTQKGKEVRSRASSSTSRFANNLKDRISDMTGSVAKKYQAAKDGAADLIDKGKQKVGIGSSGFNDNGNTDYTSNSDKNWNPSGSEILLGALIVSAASTIVWSFATEKGNQTRNRIAQGSKNIANNLKDRVSNVAGNIADGISSTYQAAKEGAVTLLDTEQSKRESVS
jgi:gas vesicle protein